MKNLPYILLYRDDPTEPEVLINEIRDTAKKFKDPVIEVEVDYDGCYYEGDQPSVKLMMKERGT